MAGRGQRVHRLVGVGHRQPVADRVQPQVRALVREHRVQAHRPVHLRPGEHGGAEDVVEVGMGEREMGHTAARQLLGLAAQPDPLREARTGVHEQCRTLPEDQPRRAVPARQPAPAHPRGQPLPPQLFPSHGHTRDASGTSRYGGPTLPRVYPAAVHWAGERWHSHGKSAKGANPNGRGDDVLEVRANAE
ncbi:hypothetical protein SCANM63S_00671 [Streptomyces canarius]